MDRFKINYWLKRFIFLALFAANSLTFASQLSLEEIGSFRIPLKAIGESNIGFAQGTLAVSKSGNSLFIVGRTDKQAIAEISIPRLIKTNRLQDMQFATYIQPFSRVLNRVSGGNKQNIDRIMGMKVIDGQLIINAVEYYDADARNTDTTLIVRDPNQLASSKVSGFYQLKGAAHAAGWISKVPSNWRKKIQNDFIVGSSSSVPINARHSMGPSAFAFFPYGILDQSVDSGFVLTDTMLDFSIKHPLHKDLNNDSGENKWWTEVSGAKYGFIIPNTDYYLTIGNSGGHKHGLAYKYKRPDGTVCGGSCPKDKNDYSNYYWLWDMNDLVAVKRGFTPAHYPQPVNVGPFTPNTPKLTIGGADFDDRKHILYVLYRAIDTAQDRYVPTPIITAYKAKII